MCLSGIAEPFVYLSSTVKTFLRVLHVIAHCTMHDKSMLYKVSASP